MWCIPATSTTFLGKRLGLSWNFYLIHFCFFLPIVGLSLPLYESGYYGRDGFVFKERFRASIEPVYDIWWKTLFRQRSLQVSLTSKAHIAPSVCLYRWFSSSSLPPHLCLGKKWFWKKTAVLDRQKLVINSVKCFFHFEAGIRRNLQNWFIELVSNGGHSPREPVFKTVRTGNVPAILELPNQPVV